MNVLETRQSKTVETHGWNTASVRESTLGDTLAGEKGAS